MRGILLQIVRENWQSLSVITLVAMAAAATEAIALSYTFRIIGLLQGPWNQATAAKFPQLITWGLIAVAVRAGLQTTALLMQTCITGRWEAVRRKMLIHEFLAANWLEQTRESSGSLVAMLTEGIARGKQVLQAISGALVHLSGFVFLLGSSFIIDPIVAGALLTAVALLAASLIPLSNASRDLGQRKTAGLSRFAAAVSDIVDHSREIKLFNASGAIAKTTDQLVSDLELNRLFAGLLAGMIPIIYQTAGGLILLATLGWLAAYSVGSVANSGLAAVLFIRSLAFCQHFQAYYQQIADGAPSLSQLKESADRLRTCKDATGSKILTDVSVLEFDRVGYRFAGRPVTLEGVSFTARRGEVLGLVGPSGAGKSTIILLAQRLLRPTTGNIRVNGIDIGEFAADCWHKAISIVPQDGKLIEGSIVENIRFFRGEVAEADVENAAFEAGIHDEIIRLPHGYQTRIGQRTGDLSVGQRQRIAIARALAGRPSVLFLDEPTSALDPSSEQRIRQMIEHLKGHMLVVIVAHRSTTLEHCDRILVLQDRRISIVDRLEQAKAYGEFVLPRPWNG